MSVRMSQGHTLFALCRFAKGAPRLLDLACGRGGDIWKWIDAGIPCVKGIDLSPHEIEEARARWEGKELYLVNPSRALASRLASRLIDRDAWLCLCLWLDRTLMRCRESCSMPR